MHYFKRLIQQLNVFGGKSFVSQAMVSQLSKIIINLSNLYIQIDKNILESIFDEKVWGVQFDYCQKSQNLEYFSGIKYQQI